MTEYLTEQEQVDTLKKLARQYIPAVILGLILAVAATTGWRSWQTHQNNIRIQASSEYDAMLATLSDQHNLPAAAQQAEALIQHFPKTVYASLAELVLAQHALAQNHLKEAIPPLQAIIKRGKKTGLYTIAHLRLARIQLANQNPKDALNTLADLKDPAFDGLMNAIRGDAYFADHQLQNAKNAYSLAVQQLPDTGILKSLTQLKFDHLPVATSGH